MEPISQRAHERGRLVVDGRRTDDGDKCSLLAVREVGGHLCLYPHGAGQLGVRLPAAEAERVARFLLGWCPVTGPQLPVPPPEFSRTAPGGPPDLTTRTRWARCPVDGRLHVVERLDLELAPVRGYTEALCGHQLPTDVALKGGPSGALCLPCVIGLTADLDDPGRFGAAL